MTRSTHARLWAALLVPALATALYFVILVDYSPQVRQTSYLIGKLLQFSLLAWAATRVTTWPRPWRRVSLTRLFFSVGLTLALVIAVLLIFFTFLKEAIVTDRLVDVVIERLHGMGITSLGKYFVFAFGYVVIHSFLEEYYWRWFVYQLCRRLLPAAGAAVLASAGFTAHHVILLTTFFGTTSATAYLFSAAVFAGGLFWTWLYRRDASLTGPWLSHALADAAVFAIGYRLAF